MYEKIQKDFAPKFDKTELNFDLQYAAAEQRVKHYAPDIAENAIRQILSTVLAEYAASHATTKIGKVLRWFSGVGAKLVKILKFQK